jgi:hypothetical protein
VTGTRMPVGSMPASSGLLPTMLARADAMAAVRASVDRVLITVAEATHEQANSLAVTWEGYDARQTAIGSTNAVISSLAEGADRIVAESGLAAGFSLETVLPFHRSEYITDFKTQESSAKFNELLKRATSVFSLDGNVDERPRAYEAASFVMLANIDLLIAIWDGSEANGIGGTAQIVSRAIADGIPVVWIDPANPEALQLSWSRPDEVPLANVNARPKEAFCTANYASITQAIKETLLPPMQAESEGSLKTYFGEQERRWILFPWFPIILWVYTGRQLRSTDFRLPAFLVEMQTRWNNYFSIMPEDKSQRPAIETISLPAYSDADPHESPHFQMTP